MQLGNVHEHVVDRKKGQPQESHEAMLAESEAHWQPSNQAICDQDSGSQRKSIDDRNLGVDRPKLEGDRQPGRAPDQCGERVEQSNLHEIPLTVSRKPDNHNRGSGGKDCY